ncbi:MAG: hypothetical protein V3R73_05225, partial [Sphingomonadales bacterium]
LGPVMVYRLFGKDGSLDAMIYQLENLGSPSGNTQFDLPFSGEIQADPRFKALVKKAGLVDYWRARGWPRYCRPVGADDFECGVAE